MTQEFHLQFHVVVITAVEVLPTKNKSIRNLGELLSLMRSIGIFVVNWTLCLRETCLRNLLRHLHSKHWSHGGITRQSQR